MWTNNSQNASVAADGHSRFRQLIDQVRTGDEDACETLVREYGAVIRREARMRLGSTYSSFLDPEDVVQSVLRSFLRRAGEGKFQLRDPAQLVRLLTQMARNKAFTALRREGRRKSVMQDAELTDVTDPRGPLDESVSRKELLDVYRRHMGPDDWQVLQWRLDGYTWPEIASLAQESPDMLRKRLQRVLEYLREHLPLE